MDNFLGFYMNMDIHNIKIDLTTQQVFKFINGKQRVFDEVLSKIFYNNNKLNTQQVILDLEKTNLIVKYDLTVAAKVAQHIRVLKLKGQNPTIPLSINISGVTVNKRAYELFLLLEDIAPYVIVEITETAQLDIKKIMEFTSEYQKIGGEIALDDFNDISNSSYRLELLNACQPNFIKLVIPKSYKNYNSFYNFCKQSVFLAPNSQLVYENVEHSYELLSILNLHKSALVQGFLLATSKPFLFDLTIKR